MRSSQSRRRSLKLHEFASRRSRSITRREGTNSTGIHTQQQQQPPHQHQPQQQQQQPPPPITNSRESSPADIDLLSLDSCSQGGPPPLSLASSISYTTGSGSNGSSAFTSLSNATTHSHSHGHSHNNHHKQPKDDSDLPYLDNDDPDQDDDHDVPFDYFQPHQQRSRDDRGGTGGGGGIGYNQHNRQRERPHSANSIATFLSTVSSHTVEATQMMKEHFTLCGAKENNNNNNRKGGGGGGSGGGDETAFPTIGSTTSNSTAATTVSNTGHGNSNTNSRLESFFNGHAATAPKHMNNTRAAEDAITDAGSGEPHAAYASAYYSQCTQSSAERLHMDELYLSDGDDNFSGSTNTIRTSKSEKTMAIHRPLPINTSKVVSTSSASSTTATTTTTTTTRECKQDPTKDSTNSSEGVGASLPASKKELPKYQNLFPDSQQLKRSASTPTVLQSRAGSAFGRVSSTISDKSNLRSSTMYKSAFAPVGSSSGSGSGGNGNGSSGSSSKLGRALYRNESLTNPTRVKGQQSHGGGINEDTVSIVSRDEESVVSRDLSTSGMSARALKKIKNRRRKRRDQRPHVKEEEGGGMGIGIGGEEQFQEGSSATHIRSIGDRDTVGVDGLRNSLDQLQDEDVNSTKEISVGELAPPPPACDSEDVIATRAGDKSTEMDTFQKLDVDVQANISLLSIVSGNVDESEDANTKSQSLSDLEFGSNSNSRLIESPSPSAYQKISDEEHSHGPSPIVGSRSSSRRSRYRNMVSPVSPYSRAVTPQPELVLPQQKMMQENMSPCSQDSCSNSRITTQSNNTCNQTLCTSYSGTLSCNRSVTSSVAEADREVRETIRRQRKKRDGADLDGSQSVHSSDTNNSNPRAYFSLSSSPAPLRDGANMPVDKFFSRNGAMISPANTKPPSFSTIPSSNLSSNIEEPSSSVDSGSLKPTAMNRLNGIPPRSDNTEKEGRNWRDSDSNSKLSYDGKTSISSKTSSSGSSSSRSRKKDKTRKYQKIRSSKHSDRTPTSTPSPCNSIPVSPAQNSQGMPLSPPNQFNYIHEPTDLQKLGAAKPQVLPRGKMILFPPMGSSSRHRISPYHSVVEDEGRPSTTSTTTQRHFSHVQDGLSLFSRTHESNISQAASAQYKKKLNEQVSAVVTPEKLDHDNLH